MKLTTNTAEGRSYLYHALTGETIAECKKDRHAKTIAHRVNCHDELVAALADCNKALSALGCDITGKSNVAEAARKARTALERAKG